MKTLHIAVLTTCMLAVAGCQTLGFEKKRVDYKSATTRVPSLEVPPDLTAPGSEDRYAIPSGNGESVESYSDYAKGGNLPQRAAASGVLPPVKGAHLEHQGADRWLVVDGPAESVWPKVKEFWQQNGFNIKTENPQAGVMETDWAENRANIPEGAIRNLLGKVLSDVYDSGMRDRYRTRLERSKDGNSTYVYITHYGMQEVLTGADKDSSKWQPRPRDPELEATMLQVLMAKLGSSAAAEATASSASGAGEAQPMLQRLPGGGSAIALNEPFDRCWRKVELALDQAGIAVEDKDRANGTLMLRAAKKEKGILDNLAFWRSEDDDKSDRIQVLVRQDASGCVVTASAADGSSNADTQRVIDALYQNMGAQAVSTSGPAAAAPALPSAPAKLQGSGDSKTILLSESIERCWNDAQMALDRAGMTPVDSDRAAGKLYLPAADRDQEGSWFSRLAFWKSGDIKMARPEVMLRAVSNGCEISVNDGNGGTNEATQHIVDSLYENLSK